MRIGNCFRNPLILLAPLVSIRRLVPLLALCLTLALGGAATAGPGPDGCGTGSWVAGVVNICDGVLTYRDYIYDDYGSSVGDPNAPSTGTLSRPDGRVRYDTDINSADLAALRLRIEGGQLHVSFELNTLRNPNSTVAALAIDTDNDPTTGGGVWSDLCAVEQPYGSGTCAVPLSSTGWEQVYLFETGDPATNTIEGTVPLPAGTTWRVQGVTGIRDRRVVMNVAFRGGIEDTHTSTSTGLWWDENQATTLATGDISAFGTTVDVGQLQPGVTVQRGFWATGYHQRVYQSDFTIAYDEGTGEIRYDQDAEGMDYVGIPPGAPAFGIAWHFYGKNQPYGIYVPELSNSPYGVQMSIHGYGANHASLVNRPGMKAVIGDGLHRIIVVPLGRGPAGWYNEVSERDVLDVLADVEANYWTDPDKIFAGGYSMGGYGTYRIASLYPDRFAGFISWVGALSGGGTKGISTLDFMGNLRQVPGAMLYSGADELVNILSYQAIQARTEELGYEHILYFHPNGEHFTFAVADNWVKEADWTSGLTLQKQPKQVTYRTEPFVWNPELGLIHDRAYWVREIRGRDTAKGDYVDVDLITEGCGGSLPLTSRTNPDPVGPDPVPWTAQEYLTTGADPIVAQPFLSGTLDNVASLFVHVSDADGACLENKTVAYEITSDGPSQLVFSDSDGTVIDMPLPGTNTYTGTIAVPEPSALLSMACGGLLLVALRRRQSR